MGDHQMRLLHNQSSRHWCLPSSWLFLLYLLFRFWFYSSQLWDEHDSLQCRLHRAKAAHVNAGLRGWGKIPLSLALGSGLGFGKEILEQWAHDRSKSVRTRLFPTHQSRYELRLHTSSYFFLNTQTSGSLVALWCPITRGEETGFGRINIGLFVYFGVCWSQILECRELL